MGTRDSSIFFIYKQLCDWDRPLKLNMEDLADWPMHGMKLEVVQGAEKNEKKNPGPSAREGKGGQGPGKIQWIG